jgi:hypothetical protein
MSKTMRVSDPRHPSDTGGAISARSVSEHVRSGAHMSSGKHGSCGALEIFTYGAEPVKELRPPHISLKNSLILPMHMTSNMQHVTSLPLLTRPVLLTSPVLLASLKCSPHVRLAAHSRVAQGGGGPPWWGCPPPPDFATRCATRLHRRTA